jgi:ribonuclease P protein subunit RPR2
VVESGQLRAGQSIALLTLLCSLIASHVCRHKLSVCRLRMAKNKQKKTQAPRNRTAQARISFLFQAAEYLSARSEPESPRVAEANASGDSPTKHNPKHRELPTAALNGDLSLLKRHALPAYLASHMFSVRQKGQGKIDKGLKRRICKRCNCLLIEGKTSSTVVENKSKSKKPWADVTLVSCLACGMQKRYPVGVKKPSSMVSTTQANQT